jgi:plasmid stability protein
MNKMIQIRNVPEKLHRKLKARAAAEGMTLTDYVAALIKRDLQRPLAAEWMQSLETRTKFQLDPAPEDVVREDRDSR